MEYKEYLTCEEAAIEYGVTKRRVQQMCKEGELIGATKKGREWMIPKEHVIPYSPNKKKPLPIGLSDYKTAASSYYYIDKTLLIRDFLDTKPIVSLFTRPRRFGKTLNMDMLRVFFEKTDEDTSVYFKNKKIWQYGSYYTKHQGRYPVIFLTFKDVKSLTWDGALQKIKKLISLEYIRHSELETSDKLSEYEIAQYQALARGDADEVDVQMSLQLLSLLLHKHHKKECIIIIDEYDTPIEQGYSCGFYFEIVNFMRNFFSGGLKDNQHLAFGFLTGILRLAKESIFSGMNNLKIDSIIDNNFSQYFGFTEDEVRELLRYYGKEDKFQELSNWYDGYRFGENEIFNPWSVMNYLSDGCFPKAYWQATGSNEVIKKIISNATPEIVEGLHQLLSGKHITTYIDTSVIYPEVEQDPYNIYSFLLVAGYLKPITIYPEHDGNFMCDVAIPNKEIAFVYEKEILNRTGQNNTAIAITQAIFSQDVQKLQTLIEELMLKSISSSDCTNESFYHGMMLGLCAVLSNKYQVKSNRESGYGRFDIALYPVAKGMPGFIFELKHTKEDNTNLNSLAEKALFQIEEKRYETEMKDAGITQINKIGIAFRGKNVAIRKNKTE